jgi:hypothetical protein
MRSDRPSDIAFTPSVKAIQTERGSRAAYARMERGRGWQSEISTDLTTFIAAQRSFFMATVNADGQPYIQHRGGPPGFLVVLDPCTLAFADFSGNRQYISLGNIADNPKVHLFLMDYAHQQRVKIWGEARVVRDDPDLLARVMPANYDAVPEQVIVITVTAWDANCPQHIPQRIDADDVARALAARDARIAALEAELGR